MITTNNKSYEIGEDQEGRLYLTVFDAKGNITYKGCFLSDDMILQVASRICNLDNSSDWDRNELNRVFPDDLPIIADESTVWDTSLIQCGRHGAKCGINGSRLIKEMVRRVSPPSTLVSVWDREDIQVLRDIISVDTKNTIDISDLPTARNIPYQIADYPVWAIDSHGKALVGANADQIETLVDVLSSYDLYVMEHARNGLFWDGKGWIDNISSAKFYGPREFPGVIKSLRGENEVIHWIPDSNSKSPKPGWWLVDKYGESLYYHMVSTSTLTDVGNK